MSECVCVCVCVCVCLCVCVCNLKLHFNKGINTPSNGIFGRRCPAYNPFCAFSLVVGLSATGASDSPILLDRSAPIPGNVIDGSQLGHDMCCQSSTTQICAQWSDFVDLESTIERCERKDWILFDQNGAFLRMCI